MTVSERREWLEQENRKWPIALREIPPSDWQHIRSTPIPYRVLRSSRFLVQVFRESNNIFRLSVVRTALGDGRLFADGISWDDLQSLKRQAGYGDSFAVEIYPPDCDSVNVANMRHIWILPEPLSIGWKAGKS